MSTTPDPTTWIKSARSSANGSCVEMRQHAAAVEVRDTKQLGQGPILRLAPTGFADWIAGAKTGELDHLTH
ncbi:DUF397 domain-containing protein [Kineosporia sp. J2-2]|uniref:DUF397 domain-containing protein n=1 Tax=Kineosporia corallincola TaxID=2835133 RepID=A0ABS5TF14_9ACTN|nr:DUF397 domain-containing protein [Kineosporia corallincola]MBT0769652.1 DUF397 domain-containing protein [Kineosporia corallincola]